MAEETLTDLSSTDISKLKVPDLKKELKLRGLSTAGNKNDLIERLQGALKCSEGASAESVDDLDEDLLNDDDDEHLETEIVMEEEENALDDSPTAKTVKRKLSEDEQSSKSTAPKKVILNRNISTSSVETDILKENKEENKHEDSERKVIKLSELSAKERLEMRAKKFGVTLSTDAKREARAERFGSKINGGSDASIKTPVNTSIDVLKQRAERFGGSVSTIMSKAENQEKLERRKARFGLVTAPNGTTSQSEKAKQRLERFKDK